MADLSFLGVGWSFPPTFTAQGNDVVMVAGEADIHESLQILLSTRLGERVMQDTFGCDLTQLVFAAIDRAFINTLTSLVSNAILYHEPRIKLNKLDVSIGDSYEGLVLISLDYTVRSTNSRFNMVFPFYINETIG